jgi:hypothetical protein
MTQMLASDVTQLDKVGYYHPDFTRSGVPGANHYIPLGSYLALGMTSLAVAYTYDFAAHGGAITPDIALGQLPAGAIVTSVLTDVLTSVTIAAGSTWALKVGSAVVASIADPSALTGVEAQTTTPLKAPITSAVALNIDVAATTAGKVRFIVQYLMP